MLTLGPEWLTIILFGSLVLLLLLRAAAGFRDRRCRDAIHNPAVGAARAADPRKSNLHGHGHVPARGRAHVHFHGRHVATMWHRRGYVRVDVPLDGRAPRRARRRDGAHLHDVCGDGRHQRRRHHVDGPDRAALDAQARLQEGYCDRLHFGRWFAWDFDSAERADDHPRSDLQAFGWPNVHCRHSAGAAAQLLFVTYILIRCYIQKDLGPSVPPEERLPPGERVKLLGALLLPIGLIFAVMGSMFFGTRNTERGFGNRRPRCDCQRGDQAHVQLGELHLGAVHHPAL